MNKGIKRYQKWLYCQWWKKAIYPNLIEDVSLFIKMMYILYWQFLTRLSKIIPLKKGNELCVKHYLKW